MSCYILHSGSKTVFFIKLIVICTKPIHRVHVKPRQIFVQFLPRSSLPYFRTRRGSSGWCSLNSNSGILMIRTFSYIINIIIYWCNTFGFLKTASSSSVPYMMLLFAFPSQVFWSESERILFPLQCDNRTIVFRKPQLLLFSEWNFSLQNHSGSHWAIILHVAWKCRSSVHIYTL